MPTSIRHAHRRFSRGAPTAPSCYLRSHPHRPQSTRQQEAEGRQTNPRILRQSLVSAPETRKRRTGLLDLIDQQTRPTYGRTRTARLARNPPMPTSTTPYPPGERRREGLRTQLQDLEAETLHVAFVSRGGAYQLLSYRLEPVRRQLDVRATAELRMLVLAQIHLCLPRRPFHDGKRGRLQWHLGRDRFEIGY